MIRTCKQLETELNKINNTTDIEVVKKCGYYIIEQGAYESEFTYTLKELVNEVATGMIKMVSSHMTMQGMKVIIIKGLN